MRTPPTAWIAALLLLAVGGCPRVASAQPLEYDVKAAYIFNLVNAAEWPPEAFRDGAMPFRVCVVDPSPFGDALKEAFHNERVLGHPVVLAAIRTPEEVAGCHVLFLTGGADVTGRLQSAASQAPVLTIGESATFTKRGGIITFVREGGRIRLDVNQRAADGVGVKLSSKIMQVARRIL